MSNVTIRAGSLAKRYSIDAQQHDMLRDTILKMWTGNWSNVTSHG